MNFTAVFICSTGAVVHINPPTPNPAAVGFNRFLTTAMDGSRAVAAAAYLTAGARRDLCYTATSPGLDGALTSPALRHMPGRALDAVPLDACSTWSHPGQGQHLRGASPVAETAHSTELAASSPPSAAAQPGKLKERRAGAEKGAACRFKAPSASLRHRPPP